MAGRFWRGAAAQEKIFEHNLRDYLAGLLGPEFKGLLGGMVDALMPQFQNVMGTYMGQAAGLGQAVPGQGLSGKATEGMMQTGADWMTGNVLGPALQAYTMPWVSMFGGAPTSGQMFQQMHAEKMGKAQSWMNFGNMMMGGGGAGGQSGCCFIFIEANNGILDRIARRYRDEHGTPLQIIGYKFLACMLVPFMRKYKLLKTLVKWSMVKPMIWAGKGFYGEQPSGKIFYPFLFGWLKIFECFGKSVMKEMIKCRG